MSRRDLISVVIAVFNRGAWLRECVESVCRQTYPNLEIIIVDDGSTDSYTQEILEKIKSEGVRVVRQPNRGPAAARNTGVRHSSGRWIFFLDSDNILFPGTIEICHELAVRNPCAKIIYNNLSQFGEVDGPFFFSTYNLWRLLQDNFMDANALLDREVFQSGHWFDENMRQGYEDWEFHLRLGLNGFFGVNAPGTLVRYRQTSSSHNKAAQERDAYLRHYIQSKHAEIFRSPEALLEIKRTWNPALSVVASAPWHGQSSERTLPRWLVCQTLQDFEVLVGMEPATDAHLNYAWFHPVGLSGTEVEIRGQLIQDSRGKYIFVSLRPLGELELPTTTFERVVRFFEAHPAAAAVVGLPGASAAVMDSSGLSYLLRERDVNRMQLPVFVCYRKIGIMPGDRYSRRDEPTRCDHSLIGAMIARRQEVYALALLEQTRTSVAGAELASDAGRCTRYLPEEDTSKLVGKRLGQSPLQASIWAATRRGDTNRQQPLSLYNTWEREDRSAAADFWFRDSQAPTYHPGSLVSDPLPQAQSSLARFRDRKCTVIAAPDSPFSNANRLMADLARRMSPSSWVHTCTPSQPVTPWIREILECCGVEWWHLPELGAGEALLESLIARYEQTLLLAIDAAWCVSVLKTLDRRRPGLRTLVHLTGEDIVSPGDWAKAACMFANLANRIDQFVVGSERLRWALIEDYCVPANKITVLPPGISPRAGRVPGADLGRPVQVLWMGPLVESKKPLFFVDIAERFFHLPTTVETEFLMIGEGDARAAIEARIREPGLRQRIRLLEGRNPEEISQRMSQASIFVLTGVVDESSYSLLEAMALGLAIVAPGVEKQVNLLGEGRGDLVESEDDPEAYARAIYELATNPPKRIVLGERAQRYVREHNSLETMLTAYTDLTAKMLGEEEQVAAKEQTNQPLDKGTSEAISKAFRDVFGQSSPEEKLYHPDELTFFCPPLVFSEDEEAQVREEIKRLSPFFQGPFPITRDLVISGAVDCRPKWRDILGQVVPPNLQGQRVLEIGCNAGYDSFSLQLRHPQYLLAVEPATHFYAQARFLNRLYRTSVDFRCLGWEALSKYVFGEFDWVFCIGVLYHEQSPMELLKRLAELTAPGGTLVLGTAVLAEEDGLPTARYVEKSYRGDSTYWWIPGQKCVEAMLKTMGFSDACLFSKHPDASLNLENASLTVEGLKPEAFGFFVGRKLSPAELPYVHPGSLAEVKHFEPLMTGSKHSQGLQLEHYRQELEQVRRELAMVQTILQNSLSYRLFRRVSDTVKSLFPRSSRRRKLYDRFTTFLRTRLGT